MKLFSKKTYSIRDIDDLIKNQAEESLMLEFKSADSIDFSDAKLADGRKTELSRDVSAMANSNGGIIIYGIKENNHIAKSKSYINGNIITKERVEQVILDRIKLPIPNLKIFPIREGNDFNKTIYLIKVPESDDSPHMAYDGSYYKRNNFNRIQFMEYEVRREYLKIKKSKLELELPVINTVEGKFHNKGEKKFGHFRIWFHIKNVGKVLEQYFKLELLIPHSIHQSYYREPNPLEKYKTHTFQNSHKFSIPSQQIIFPDEQLRLCSSFIFLKENQFTESIKMKLFYSGGYDERTFTVAEMFDYQYEREAVSFDLKYQARS